MTRSKPILMGTIEEMKVRKWERTGKDNFEKLNANFRKTELSGLL